MNRLRKGESTSYPFRSERMYTVGHEWFFATREGIDQGPFVSRERAEQALLRFIVSVGGSASHTWQASRPD